MKIDTTPSQVATNALAGLPFSQIIGSPLKAAIEAQAMAAETTWKFIQEVGLNTDPETGRKEAVNVTFDFIRDGKQARLNVPLLTIVPIPYIAINTIDIAFKAKINAESSAHNEASESSDVAASAKLGMKVGFGPFSATLDASASYSSKKDSKATQDSKYSVEYTLDIAVKAGQDSMPAGLARVLDILNNSLSVADSQGELGANIMQTEDGKLQLVATYRNPEGLFKPEEILIGGNKPTKNLTDDGKSLIYDVTETDKVTVTVGKGDNALTKTVDVPKQEVKETPKE
jgi:hypothetical protein